LIVNMVYLIINKLNLSYFFDLIFSGFALF